MTRACEQHVGKACKGLGLRQNLTARSKCLQVLQTSHCWKGYLPPLSQRGQAGHLPAQVSGGQLNVGYPHTDT